ncbi:GL13719 [Drosophila persimilis]|uniref:GL13719 n=1 Tax=Drosophila persimilis TaxID=7234 RepID=B4GNV2_DROPE|nr:GL13719 [Drosophila persimilis]
MLNYVHTFVGSTAGIGPLGPSTPGPDTAPHLSGESIWVGVACGLVDWWMAEFPRDENENEDVAVDEDVAVEWPEQQPQQPVS